jgi:hypothetical protein
MFARKLVLRVYLPLSSLHGERDRSSVWWLARKWAEAGGPYLSIQLWDELVDWSAEEAISLVFVP